DRLLGRRSTAASLPAARRQHLRYGICRTLRLRKPALRIGLHPRRDRAEQPRILLRVSVRGQAAQRLRHLSNLVLTSRSGWRARACHPDMECTTCPVPPPPAPIVATSSRPPMLLEPRASPCGLVSAARWLNPPSAAPAPLAM